MAMALAAVAVAVVATVVPARAAAVEIVTANPTGAAWTAWGGHDDDESARAGCDAAFGEEFAKAFDGAADAFLRRVFTRAHCGADASRKFRPFIKPEHDGLAILLAQARHGGIQQRSDLPPDGSFPDSSKTACMCASCSRR